MMDNFQLTQLLILLYICIVFHPIMSYLYLAYKSDQESHFLFLKLFIYNLKLDTHILKTQCS